jgi:hypothetical protein
MVVMEIGMPMLLFYNVFTSEKVSSFQTSGFFGWRANAKKVFRILMTFKSYNCRRRLFEPVKNSDGTR